MKKFRAILFFAIIVSFLLVVGASNVFAADCASAVIKRVGSNPSIGATGSSPYMVQLDCSTDSVWPGTLTLYLSSDLGDGGLATLLTAYSLGKTVWVRTLGITSGSIVTIIYVND